jgi:hypothetical protein
VCSSEPCYVSDADLATAGGAWWFSDGSERSEGSAVGYGSEESSDVSGVPRCPFASSAWAPGFCYSTLSDWLSEMRGSFSTSFVSSS